MPEFLAETYAPRDPPGTDTAARRAGQAALAADQVSQPEARVRLLGAIVVAEEETCFYLYQASSAGAVRAAVTGANPQFVAVDPDSGTAFVMNQYDNTLSAINTSTCNGTVTSGCQNRAPAEQASPDAGPGYNPFPNAFALVPQTGTAYVVNVGGAPVMSVVSVSGCDATDTAGCRAEAPAVPDHEFLLSADPATSTIYAGNTSLPQIDVLNGATCHAGNLAGCAPVAEIPMGHPQANVGAIDNATHTLYASDPSADSVSVINTAACNAGNTTGCADEPAAVLTVGAAPHPPALNQATGTLYVPYGSTGTNVAVINAATCNATRTSGCGQTPAVVTVPAGTYNLAVSTATDTVYAPDSGSSFSGDTMAVINGATCNATDHAGCTHLAATVTVGSGPYGVTVDDRTHTVYVVNNADGDTPGTVSVINGATCNGTDTAGCTGPFPTIAVGRSPLLAALDVSTGIIYVTDFSSATVSIINGSTCNASVTSGCGAPPREQPAGSQPFGLAIDPDTGTVYVADTFQAGSLSILSATSS